MVFGVTALVVQALVLPWLLCITNERNVLAIGTCSDTASTAFHGFLLMH